MLRLAFSPRRVAVVLGLAVVALVAHPTWATALGIDVWNLPALHEHIEATAAKHREMERQDEAILQRVEFKDRLVSNLIAGRTTLAEVTPVFLSLNQNQPGYMTAIRVAYPGRSDEERIARNILARVAIQLAYHSPSTSHEVNTRLEAELSQLVADTPAEAE